jgi:hypothetical protein
MVRTRVLSKYHGTYTVCVAILPGTNWVPRYSSTRDDQHHHSYTPKEGIIPVSKSYQVVWGIAPVRPGPF